MDRIVSLLQERYRFISSPELSSGLRDLARIPLMQTESGPAGYYNGSAQASDLQEVNGPAPEISDNCAYQSAAYLRRITQERRIGQDSMSECTLDSPGPSAGRREYSGPSFQYTRLTSSRSDVVLTVCGEKVRRCPRVSRRDFLYPSFRILSERPSDDWIEQFHPELCNEAHVLFNARLSLTLFKQRPKTKHARNVSTRFFVSILRSPAASERSENPQNGRLVWQLCGVADVNGNIMNYSFSP